jgi:hypothetical protein
MITLLSAQSPKYLPPFVIYLQPGSKAFITQPNGCYFDPSDVLYLYPGANIPSLPDGTGPGQTPSVTASMFPPGLPTPGVPGPGGGIGIPGIIAQFSGQPLVLAFLQQGPGSFRVGDGQKSGTTFVPAGSTYAVTFPPGVGGPKPIVTGPCIVIPSGELLLFMPGAPWQIFGIGLAAGILNSGLYQVNSIGG